MKHYVIMLFFALVLSGCGDEQPPKTIQEISSQILSVHERGDELRIELAAVGALRAKDHFQNASMNTMLITEKLVRYFRAVSQRQLTYVISVEGADKYGNQTVAPVLELRYEMADLKKVNFANMYHKQLLDLATSVRYLNNTGKEVVRVWCSEKDNQEDAARFCARNT